MTADAMVYPRVGGETQRLHAGRLLSEGLSPRGRGNHRQVGDIHACPGSIPAWAGKPSLSSRSVTDSKVYPRVGGETFLADEQQFGTEGLSPRGRGNRRVTSYLTVAEWSIPAWAGKPLSHAVTTVITRVYPRVGGETYNRALSEGEIKGLSPRGRGNLGDLVLGSLRSGSIPAWAGKPRAAEQEI